MSLSVLPYALGAAGLLNSADQGRRARNQAGDAQRQADAEAYRRQQIQQRVQAMIEGSGTYAESEGMRRAERAREGFNRNSSQLMESTAGAFRVAGYKPGDTVTGDAVARVGRERALKFDELINDLIASAKAERMSEAGAIASSAGITGPNQAYYADQAARYREQADRASSGVLGSLQTIMDATQAGRKPDQPEQPPASATPDPLATYQTPQDNPYKGFDSLNVSDIFPKRKTNRFASPLFG